MQTLQEFSNRLSQAMKLRRIKQGELAAALRVSPSTVSRLLGGQTEPHPRTLEALAAALEIRKEWLSAGLGEMEPESSRLQEPSVAVPIADKSSLIRRLAQRVGARGMWDVMVELLEKEAATGEALPDEVIREFQWMLLLLTRQGRLKFHDNESKP